MRAVELVALQVVAWLARCRAVPYIDPARLGNAQRTRIAHAGEQHRRAHVDEGVGHHVSGVRPGDEAVVSAGFGHLLGCEAATQPGMGVGRGDL